MNSKQIKLKQFKEYVLDEKDIKRIHSKAGKKHLVRVDNISEASLHAETMATMAKIDREHGYIAIKFVYTKNIIFYASYKIDI